MTSDVGRPPRRRRERAEIDQLVFDAVRAMLTRDGVLAGFTLQNVAEEAGVNRVQLYQNFGSKQALLRAAINDVLERQRSERDAHRELPFAQRRRSIFEQFLADPNVVQLEALLAQDGDQEFVIFPEIHLTADNLERDLSSGALPSDADGMALHLLTAATYMGYCIFREGFSRDAGIPLEELDARILAAFSYLLNRLVDGEASAS